MSEITSEGTEVLETPSPVESLGGKSKSLVGKAFPLAIVLLMVGLTSWSVWVLGTTIYRDYLVVPDEMIVPNVVGLEIKAAYDKIEEQGLRLQIYESRHDKKAPKRVVLSQNPSAGRKVREGRTVLITVSLGPELMEVPKVEGESLRTAKITLSNSKLQLGKVTFEEGAYGEDEAVIKQNPEAGKQVQRGQLVHLVVRRAYR